VQCVCCHAAASLGKQFSPYNCPSPGW